MISINKIVGLFIALISVCITIAKYRIKICATKIYLVISYFNKLFRWLNATRIEAANKIKVEYLTLCKK
jgi:ABC-type uncharacterized transport system involved in gliding motility auxiliary subunit